MAEVTGGLKQALTVEVVHSYLVVLNSPKTGSTKPEVLEVPEAVF